MDCLQKNSYNEEKCRKEVRVSHMHATMDQ